DLHSFPTRRSSDLGQAGSIASQSQSGAPCAFIHFENLDHRTEGHMPCGRVVKDRVGGGAAYQLGQAVAGTPAAHGAARFEQPVEGQVGIGLSQANNNKAAVKHKEQHTRFFHEGFSFSCKRSSCRKASSSLNQPRVCGHCHFFCP